MAIPARNPPVCAAKAGPLKTPAECSSTAAAKSCKNQKERTSHAGSQNSPLNSRTTMKKNQRKFILVLGNRRKNPPRQAEIAPEAPPNGISDAKEASTM